MRIISSTHIRNLLKATFNMDEARRKRAAALEEKKRRLEEMRRKRAVRENEGESLGEERGSAAAGNRALTRGIKKENAEKGGNRRDDQEQLDALIDSLLNVPAPSTENEGEDKSGKREINASDNSNTQKISEAAAHEASRKVDLRDGNARVV